MMFEDQLEIAARSDEKERILIINELIKQPDEALQAALNILARPLKHVWAVAVQIIHAIGYPKNAPAIPSLVAYVGNSNAPGWESAVETLVDLGAPIVVPYLIAYLWEKDRHQFWGDDVEGICLMLVQANREFARMCGPTIIYILSQNNSISSNELDKGFLLDVLEKISSVDIEYAMPILIDLVKQEGASKIGDQARKLLASFSEQIIDTYRLILPSTE